MVGSALLLPKLGILTNIWYLFFLMALHLIPNCTIFPIEGIFFLSNDDFQSLGEVFQGRVEVIIIVHEADFACVNIGYLSGEVFDGSKAILDKFEEVAVGNRVLEGLFERFSAELNADLCHWVIYNILKGYHRHWDLTFCEYGVFK
jgi:hypothetical protein